jgi:peptidoglycan/LPS O-acetylase OafA/YrhL
MKEELRGLTIVRFFAALIVVLFHFRGDLGQIPQALENLLSSGYTGVSLFFILSGFILVYVAGGRGIVTRDFLVRRVARIYPVYLLAWVAFGVGLLLLAGIGPLIDTHAVGGALSIVMLQAWVPDAPWRWNLPAWSLSVEAFFYLSFPLLYRAMVGIRDRALWAILVTAFLVNAAHLYLVRIPPEVFAGTPFADRWSWENYASWLPLFRIQQFVAGMTVGLLFLRHRRAIPYLLPVSIAATVGLWLFPEMPYVYRDAWLTPVYCALIYALAMVSAPGMFGSVGVLLGKASYSVYILHFPLWALWEPLMAPSPLRLALFLVGLCGLSIAVYQWLERPAEKWVKAWAGGPTSPAGYSGPPQPTAGRSRSTAAPC